MGSLLQMPGSHIVNFLESLERYGIETFWIERIRKDRYFGEKATKAMMMYYFESLEKYTIRVNPSLSRVDMNRRLIKSGFGTIRNDLLTAFYPKNAPDRDLPQYKEDFFIFPLFYPATEEDVLAIIDAYGYESASIEEALTFALWFGANSATGHAITLSSKLVRETGKSEFLQFGYFRDIGIYEQNDGKGFRPMSQFLIKKKS